jgi:hypothetical protein
MRNAFYATTFALPLLRKADAPEFLPQHRAQRQQVLQLVTATEARGQERLAEMNRQVLHNLDNIITALDERKDTKHAG